jgi:hypothetical protein
MLNDALTKLFDGNERETLIPNLAGYKFTVFNPQLNNKPFHNNYNITISSAIEFMHNSTYRFIVLNWSSGTDICGNKINHGISALLSVESYMTPLAKNRFQCRGVVVKKPKGKYFMLYFPSCKHMFMYTIASNFNAGQARVMKSSQYSPLAILTHDEKWSQSESLCQIDWTWVNRCFLLQGLSHECFEDKNCCPSTDVENFFLSFFVNGFGGDEYQINEPYTQGLKEPSVAGKRERLERLANFIKMGKLPPPLVSFAKTACWCHKRKNRNLKLKVGNNEEHYVRLLHEDTVVEAVAAYAKARKNEDDGLFPPIYVYYPTESGYEIYTPATSTEIFPKEKDLSLIHSY